MTRRSSKSKKLRNVNPVRGRTGNVPIQERKINCAKNQSHRAYYKYLMKQIRLKCKFENGASVSDALALFNCSLGG